MSAVVLVIVIAAMLLLGGNVLLGFLGGVSIIGLFELYRIWGIHKGALLGIFGYAAAAIYYVLLYFEKMDYLLMLVIILLKWF